MRFGYVYLLKIKNLQTRSHIIIMITCVGQTTKK